MISLDTETTGVDFWHSAIPYIVTSCDLETKQITTFEWFVNPLTRQPEVPDGDLDLVRQLIESADQLALHNAKFDCHAVKRLLPEMEWPWHKTVCTLIAAHLLGSNLPHNLTDTCVLYIGHDIQPLEDAVREETIKARKLAKKQFPTWWIAEEGDPRMPSVKGSSKRDEDKPWKNDMWLPRCMARELKYKPDHPWWHVTRRYAEGDSEATCMLAPALLREIADRKLDKLFRERMRLLPIAAEMEDKGVSVSLTRLNELQRRYETDRAAAERECVAAAGTVPCKKCPTAASLFPTVCKNCNGRGLVPKMAEVPGGTSNLLKEVLFDDLQIKPIGWTDTGEPKVTEESFTFWQSELPDDSRAFKFVKNLALHRKLTTFLNYLMGYRRFGIIDDEWLHLHMNLNPTGTSTLRWSSYNPNSQNISTKEDTDGHSLRHVFGPAPGREWFSLDAKNLELRIPAYEAGETEQITLFENPDQPPYYGSNHLLNFHTVYPDIWEAEQREVGFELVGPHIKKKYDGSWYKRCKGGGFGLQYGGQDKTVDRAFGRPGARAKVAGRFARIHGPGGLNARCIAHADRHGWIETLPDKSVDPERGYPLLVTRTEYGSARPTVPLNYRTQGTACWWIGRAMVRVAEFFTDLNRGLRFEGRAWDGGYRIILQVHDELDIDCPSGARRKAKPPWSYNLPVVRQVKELMEMGGRDIGVPTPVDVGYHQHTWAEGEKISA